MIDDGLLKTLLDDALDDWVHAAQLWARVGRCVGAGSRGDLRDELLGAVEAMLASGCFEAGDVRVGSGFVPWAVPASEAAARIRAEWDALGRYPYPGDICWFAITERGRQRARELGSVVS